MLHRFRSFLFFISIWNRSNYFTEWHCSSSLSRFFRCDCVVLFHMCIQIRPWHKAQRAQRTVVRFLQCMQPNVNFHRCYLSELLATKFASVFGEKKIEERSKRSPTNFEYSNHTCTADSQCVIVCVYQKRRDVQKLFHTFRRRIASLPNGS